MPNRHQRRAFSRAHKATHKIEPQMCVLWIPDARGFLQSFTRDGFTVMDTPQLAQHFCEDHAPSAAITIRELFGLRAVVRPVYDSEPVVMLTPRGEAMLAH
jgi:hypothetical protein